jgi:hypothetical protein
MGWLVRVLVFLSKYGLLFHLRVPRLIRSSVGHPLLAMAVAESIDKRTANVVAAAFYAATGAWGCAYHSLFRLCSSRGCWLSALDARRHLA